MNFKYALLFIVFQLFSCSKNSAQEIEKAEFTLRLLDWKLNENSALDTSLVALSMQRMADQVNTIYAGNEGFLIAVQQDTLGDVVFRKVFDKEKIQNHIFSYSGGFKFYKLDTTSSETFFSSNQANLNLIKSEKLKEKVFGFSAVRSEYEGKGDKKVVCISTPDFKLFKPAVNLFPYPVIPTEDFILEMTLIDKELSFTIGVKDFKNEISNPNWFSIDTEGFESADDWKEIFSGERKEKERKELGMNLEILEAMISKEYLPADFYGLDNYRKEKANFDKPGLVSLLLERNSSFFEKNPKEIISCLDSVDLLSANAKKSLENYAHKMKEMNPHEKGRLVILVLIHHHLNKKEIREGFSEKLISRGIVSKNVENSSNYISGEISLSDFLLTSKFAEPIKLDSLFTFKDLGIKIQELFDLAFKETGVELSYQLNDEKLFVFDGSFQHEIPFHRFGNSESGDVIFDYQRQSLNYVYLNILNEVIPKIKQISADNSLKYSFGIYKFSSAFRRILEGYAHENLTKKYPELVIFNHNLALVKYEEKEWQNEPIPVSFEKNLSFSEGNQLVMENFFSADELSGVSYLKTEKKQMFIDYLTKNKVKFDLKNERIQTISEIIYKQLIQSPFDLLSYIPNISFEASAMNIKKELDASKNTFKEAFPRINEFLKEDFEATNLKIENSFLYFEHGGKEYRCWSDEQSVMEEIIPLLQKKSGRNHKIYTFRGLALTKRPYYYLTLEDKKNLQELFDIRFITP